MARREIEIGKRIYAVEYEDREIFLETREIINARTQVPLNLKSPMARKIIALLTKELIAERARPVLDIETELEAYL